MNGRESTIEGEPPEAFPGHDGGLYQPAPGRIAASWPAGTFAENLAVDESGAVFVTLHTHQRVERYDPNAGTVETFVNLPAPVTGLAFAADGTLWATGGAVGQAPGHIWRIDRNGNVEQWLELPDVLFLNGCTPHPDGHTVLACEAAKGQILAVDQRGPAVATWLEDERLLSGISGIPGANGIKVWDGSVWVSVTGRNLIYRAPILEDGSVGELVVAAENLRGDDFAFAASGNLYIATHPAQTVLRLATDGSRTTIAGPAEGAVGSTSCAFGRAPGDESALYVTTTGGLTFPYRGEVQEAKLLRLEVGEVGHPLLQL